MRRQAALKVLPMRFKKDKIHKVAKPLPLAQKEQAKSRRASLQSHPLRMAEMRRICRATSQNRLRVGIRRLTSW